MQFGTDYGLNRFDGYNFKAVTKKSNGLQSNEVKKALEDKNGFGGGGGGAYGGGGYSGGGTGIGGFTSAGDGGNSFDNATGSGDSNGVQGGATNPGTEGTVTIVCGAVLPV